MLARPHITDPKAVTDLNFTAHLHVPTNFCSTFPSYKPLETVLNILRDISPLSSGCWPHQITFLSCFTTVHLCLWILSVLSGQTWSVWDSWSQVLLHPWATVTISSCSRVSISAICDKRCELCWNSVII